MFARCVLPNSNEHAEFFHKVCHIRLKFFIVFRYSQLFHGNWRPRSVAIVFSLQDVSEISRAYLFVGKSELCLRNPFRFPHFRHLLVGEQTVLSNVTAG